MSGPRSPQALVVLIGTMGLVLLGAGAGAGIGIGSPGTCCPQGDPVLKSADDPDALDLLESTVTARSRTSYSGTRMVSSWAVGGATSMLVDVEHVAGQGTVLTLRGGGVTGGTATFLPTDNDEGTPLGEPGISSSELLTASYEVSSRGTDVVAGREAGVVQLDRGGILVARLWIDRASGLLLRREVFDASGQLIGVSAFVDLDIADGVFIDHLPPSRPSMAADQVSVSAGEQLQAAGWDCPTQLGTLVLVAIEQLGGSGAMHLSYSDGLFRVSLFEQRGTLDAEAMAGLREIQVGETTAWLEEGIPSYAVWQGDGIVYTAVSDAPADVLAGVIDSSPPTEMEERGFWGRVGFGLSRLSVWVSPIV